MLPWIQTSKELVFASHIVRLFRVGFRSPASGKEGIFDVVELKDWVNVVAVTPDDEVILVRQFRFGSADITLEFPAGTVDAGQAPLDTAVRELAEETGAVADAWESLGWSHPNPALQGNRCHVFLARGARVTKPVSFDEYEEIELVRVPLSEIDGLIRDGKITHALSIVSWHRYRSRG
jgi:8-oxo-dGTP pyrophosphatase MutT (NUDIX family)